MRFCGSFKPNRTLLGPFWRKKRASDGLENLADPENRTQPNGLTSKRIGSALLAIDDANRRSHGQTGVAQRLDRLQESAAGSYDVLDEADGFTLGVHTLEAVRSAVLLRGLANDQKREPGSERSRGRERDGAKLGPGQTRRLRLEVVHRARDPLTERRQDVGPRLEAVFVQVVTRPLSRAQQEVALEIGVLAERELQLVVGQVPRVLRMTSRASGRSRSAPGE